MNQKIAIVMGSGSDRPIMDKAAAMLERFGVEHTVNPSCLGNNNGQGHQETDGHEHAVDHIGVCH